VGIDPDRVTACIPTRGNVDLREILDTLIFKNVIVKDNSQGWTGTYGRYMAIGEATTDVVYTQDDDVIVPAETQQAMCDMYADGEMLSNMEPGWHKSEYGELAWFGWGALIRRDLPEQAFDRWRSAGYSTDTREFRLFGCDVVCSILTPHRRVALAYEHLPHAFGEDRLYKQGQFWEWKRDFYEKALALR